MATIVRALIGCWLAVFSLPWVRRESDPLSSFAFTCKACCLAHFRKNLVQGVDTLGSFIGRKLNFRWLKLKSSSLLGMTLSWAYKQSKYLYKVRFVFFLSSVTNVLKRLRDKHEMAIPGSILERLANLKVYYYNFAKISSTQLKQKVFRCRKTDTRC